MNAPLVGQDQTEQRNFTHLVFDIAWFGLALAATSRFLSVYAIRLGATPVDLGWISSLPALMLMLSASFGSLWAKRFQNARNALILPSFGFRLLFLLPVFAPLLPREWQPLYLILAVSIPAIPQGIAGVTFITVMRQSVSNNQMPTLLGRRALAMNATIGAGALGFGLLLEQVAFPTNYQLMFLSAFAFALISLWHVSRLNVNVLKTAPVIVPPPVPVAEQPAPTKSTSPWQNKDFRSVALLTGIVHLAFFAIVPITPLFLVNRLGADEGFMAIYGMLELFAGAVMSVFAPRLIERFGSRAVIGLAMGGTALAALVTAISPNLPVTLIGAALSGGSWTTVASVGLMSFFMERTPSEETTKYSTAFHQSIGLAVFVGPMIGSLMANNGGDLLTILLLGAVLRLAAAGIIEFTHLRPRYLVWRNRPAETTPALRGGLPLRLRFWR